MLRGLQSLRCERGWVELRARLPREWSRGREATNDNRKARRAVFVFYAGGTRQPILSRAPPRTARRRGQDSTRRAQRRRRARRKPFVFSAPCGASAVFSASRRAGATLDGNPL